MSKKILVIEDDEFIADAYRMKLAEEAGFEVVIAGGGDEALKKAKSFKPDLIILDLLMSGIDGFGILEQWKKEGYTEQVPILVATNLEDFASIQRAMKLGARDFFVKSKLMMDDLVTHCEDIFESLAAKKIKN